MTGRYVDAGGVETYYEVDGEGEPVILLHGGFLGGAGQASTPR